MTGTGDPIDLLFGGMRKLGPGSEADTLHVLGSLPRRTFEVVVDAGCGTGRQTLTLARELGAVVNAVDSHGPFLDDLARRAADARLAPLVRVHRMDMKDIPQAFDGVDLLWSEGAAYNIGFSHALTTWAPSLNEGGIAVVSELSWLKEDAPRAGRAFFKSAYPDMQTVRRNAATAQAAGYRILTTHTLPTQAWMDDYYDVLTLRAEALLDHSDPSVRELARDTVREIEVFRLSDGSYGYVFYVLRREAFVANAPQRWRSATRR
ncbi:MAG: class I SAM-dependent methyltransferase [Thermoleophilaceae bacterium]